MNNISRVNLDCIFISPPGGGNTNDYFFYNIGSAFLISFLRLHGYKAEQFISSSPINLDSCVRQVLMLNPKIVGFTTFNTNFLTSVLIAEKIIKISPGTIIIFGGPTATNYSEFILERYPFIDACFRNEGEETFLQFISQLSENGFDFAKIDRGKIKGISYRVDSEVYMSPDSNILAENSVFADYLDKYPSPYLNNVIPGPDAFNTGILTARGCNQNCIYCNCAVMSKRRITTHSVDRVINELDYLSRYSQGKQVLNIYDDAFSLIPKRAKRICSAIIENKIRIPLSCITRCDYVDEELLDLMREAGFITVAFSLESANPKTLRIIGKVHKAEDNPSDTLERETLFIEKLSEMSAYAKKTGIKNVFSSIMTGLPNETLSEANKTIETIDNCTDIDSCAQNLFTIYKGTPLYDTYQKYGYKLDFVDDNPIFSKTIYPDDVIYKMKVSSKSQSHESHKSFHNRTMRILSLAHEKNNSEGWFNNIVIFSDITKVDLVDWLKSVLALNGNIIQIYSDFTALEENSGNNYEIYIKNCSPSLNIRNYYLERSRDLLRICYHSPLIRSDNERIAMTICDFDYFDRNMDNPQVNFLKVICKESGPDDANSAYTYFNKIQRKDSLFNYLINKKPFPYFSNLCKWTKVLSNCRERNTLFVNDRHDVRLCWYGQNIGRVGQSYDSIIERFEAYQDMISEQRKCAVCNARDRCIKCVNPFPLTDEDYCNKQKNNDISKVAELFMSIDVFKQYI